MKKLRMKRTVVRQRKPKKVTDGNEADAEGMDIEGAENEDNNAKKMFLFKMEKPMPKIKTKQPKVMRRITAESETGQAQAS